jgi:hypothetical protein
MPEDGRFAMLREVARDLPRVLGVLAYHARRALGARDRGRTALLAEPDHVIVRAWLVRQAERLAFSIRRWAPDHEITIILRHRPRLRPFDSTGCDYLLLAGGHARKVVVIPPSQGSQVVLRLGGEHHSKPLPGQEVMPELTPPTDPKDVALAVYTELGAMIRALTDVRFKLLALVPTISALALVAIVSPSGPLEGASAPVRVAAALAGFVVTAMVRMYDVRNSELYDDLISRARSLEASLGVELGAFNHRRSSVWPVEHDRALRWLYWTVLAAWLAAAMMSLIVPASPAPQPT